MQMIYDPRHFAIVYPDSNMIIKQALQVQEKKLEISDLVTTLANMLKYENDALINVALNLAPSLEVTQIVWSALNLAINSVQNEAHANIFAIPIVLVVGSKNKVKLKYQLSVEVLNDFMLEKQIFVPGGDGFVSAKLIDPQNIASLKPSQQYYWVRNLQKARLWLPIEITVSPIEVLSEGVFLRFLIGVTMDEPGSYGLDTQAFSANAMELMRLIHAELKADGVTLFPIPFSPVPLSEAFTVGNRHRVEIAIQVAVSNVVRKIRERMLTPIALISTEGEAIKVVIKTEELNIADADLSETSLWSLSHLDDFDKILATITALMNDAGIKWVYATTSN